MWVIKGESRSLDSSPHDFVVAVPLPFFVYADSFEFMMVLLRVHMRRSCYNTGPYIKFSEPGNRNLGVQHQIQSYHKRNG